MGIYAEVIISRNAKRGESLANIEGDNEDSSFRASHTKVSLFNMLSQELSNKQCFMTSLINKSYEN